MPAEPEPAPAGSTSGPPPTINGQPVPPDDYAALIRFLGKHGLSPDPITPDEAAEELDDREADDAPPDPATDKRSWAELDACVEAERRCELDFIDLVMAATEKFIKPVEEPDGGTSLRYLKSPHVSDALGNTIETSLRELHRTVAVIARRLRKP